MYWIQTAYNLNNIVTSKKLLENCYEKGIEQIIVGDEGPYAWMELEDINRSHSGKLQIIYSLLKAENGVEVLWLFKGDVFKAAANLEEMYRTKKFTFQQDTIPVYIPNEETDEQTHKKTVSWLEKIATEHYVMVNQDNKQVFEDHSFLNEKKTYIHRTRNLEMDDAEITEIRRKINGEKNVVTEYQHFLKPEHFLRGEGIHETKKKFKKVIGYLKISTETVEVQRKMEYWNKEKMNSLRMTNNWSRFFNGEVNIPKSEEEKRKILLLCTLAGQGFNKRYGKDNKTALENLKNELTVVVNLGFYEYFLMVEDFTAYAHANNIKIGQRGSVIGSVLAYCLAITDVDPIAYGLKFERFLAKDRADKPDIDTDVQASRLKEMLDYIKEKYGEENVAKIITFSSFGLRIAINNVRRVAGVKVKLEESLPKINVPLNEFLKTEAFENFMAKMAVNGHRSIIENAILLAELPKNYSIHTAGIVISEEIRNVPVIIKEGERIIPFSKNGKQIERMGFIKFDFLSAPILDVIMQAKEMIGENVEIPEGDVGAFETISSSNSYGLFQIKSQGIKGIARQIKPKNLSDVMDILALYRPGPKDEVNAYLKNREQKNYLLTDLSGVRLPETKVLEPMLKRTNGILIYQEQIMETSEMWAGFSKEEADNFRIAVSSKDKKKMEQQRTKFMKKSLELGRKAETTEKIFEIIKKFAEYGFGKSHAAGYAIRTYETAYLKKYYTEEFMIVLANAALSKNDEIVEVLREMKRLKMPLEKPDLKRASILFQKKDGKVLFSLVAIKGIGFVDAQSIEASGIKNAKTIKEFCEYKGINLGVKEVLVKAGIVDYLGDRWQNLQQLRKDKEEYKKNKNAEERKVIYKKWEKELIRF